VLSMPPLLTSRVRIVIMKCDASPGVRGLTVTAPPSLFPVYATWGGAGSLAASNIDVNTGRQPAQPGEMPRRQSLSRPTTGQARTPSGQGSRPTARAPSGIQITAAGARRDRVKASVRSETA
jgi:hypothetical protein